MSWVTAEQIAKSFEALPPDTKLCPSCYHVLSEYGGVEGMVLMCPNMMCLNEKEYPIKEAIHDTPYKPVYK